MRCSLLLRRFVIAYVNISDIEFTIIVSFGEACIVQALCTESIIEAASL